MFVAFRADASYKIGTGHVMRCLTLAESLCSEGAYCVFVCRNLSGNLAKVIEARGFSFRMLPVLHYDSQLISDSMSPPEPVGTSCLVDAEQTLDVLGDRQWDWLVVDHYGLDSRWERILRQRCRQILVLDDLADRIHDCDLLVDPGAEPDLFFRHARCVLPETCLYVGPKYALLRSEFDRERMALSSLAESIIPRRLLVMFGGNDIDGNSLEAIETIARTAPADVEVDIIVSCINQDIERIKSFCETRTGYQLHSATSDVARLMVTADLVVASGGGATWERLYLRRPGLVKAIADNQRKPLEYLANAGCFEIYNDSFQLQKALHYAFSVGVKRPPDIVSNGTPVITRAIMNRLVSLEPFSALDVRRTFYWLQDSDLRDQFLMRGGTPVRRNHFQYWRKLLSDPYQRIFAIRQGRRHIGNAGLRSFNDISNEAELWLYFGSENDRGAGLGKVVLSQLHAYISNHLKCSTAFLYVAKKNTRAYSLYVRAGYVLSQKQDSNAAGFLPEMDVVRMERHI